MAGRGNCKRITCPYHAWSYALDGQLLAIPSMQGAQGFDKSAHSLPNVRAETWAGFVFINPDPDAAPLADHLGDTVEQFEVWNLEDRYVEGHVSRVINANWKIAQEAFCEAYHVNATHPQILTYLGDINSQVDVFDNCSRVITPGGTPSPLLGMEIHADDLQTGLPKKRLEFVYSEGKKKAGPRTAAKTHGGFDNDVHTMNDILRRVTGNDEPKRPFTADDLDY